MDFLSNIGDRDELMAVLHLAIDKIYKSNSASKKYADNDLNYIANIYKQYCANQITKSELLEYFPVADELKNCVITAIEVRKSQVCQHLLDVASSAEVPVMKSFDWDVKLISGDSSLVSRRETIVTIALNCQNGLADKQFSMELDSEMIDKLIVDLENQIEK